MTPVQQKAIYARVKKLARDARSLAIYDGHSSPPDWRPFVAELADEVAKILAPPQRGSLKRRKGR
jgi:hypothetical protein